MEILSKDTVITGAVPRIVETPDKLIINTQVCDISSMKPIPMKFETINSGTSICTLYRTIWTNQNDTLCTYEFLHAIERQNIIQDTNDPDIWYLIAKYGSFGIAFYKIKKRENDYQILHTFNVYSDVKFEGYYCGGDTKRGFDYVFLYQTDRYIIYKAIDYSYMSSQDSWAINYNNRYSIYKYDKINQVNIQIQYGNSNFRNIYSHYFMEYDNDNIYFFVQYTNNFYIIKNNLSTNVNTTLLSLTLTDVVYVIGNIVKLNDYYYFIADNYPQSGIHEYCFYKIKLDKATDTITYEIVNIIGDTFDISANIGNGIFHTLRTLESNGKQYIVLTVHSVPNINYYPVQHRNVVFRLEEDSLANTTSLVVTDNKLLATGSSNGCKGVMQYIDANILIMLLTDCFNIYKFDNTTEKYNRVFTKGGIFYMIGFDALNRLYAQYNTGAIDVFSVLNTQELKADFEEELYYKNIANEEINTNIYFYAKNMLNNYIETDVKLTLVGEAVFTDTGTKQIESKTLQTGIKTIPVTITGRGRIDIIITQNT